MTQAIPTGWNVLIDGVDVTPYWREQDNSLTYDEQVNARSMLAIELIDPLNTLRVSPGESIVFRNVLESHELESSDDVIILSADGVPILAPNVDVFFGGTVERVSEQMLGSIDDTLRQINVEAVSFDQLADRVTIAKVYEGWLAGDIARDLVSLRLAEDGVTDVYVEDGPRLEFELFNYITVAEALDRLSSHTGYLWYIDNNRALHFQARKTEASPFAITDATPHAQAIRVVSSRTRYRNRQIIRAGRDLTDPREELFVGDGERRTFNLAFPCGEVPAITLNGVPQTRGIRGVETGKQWYWNKDVTEISQSDDATPALTGLDTLSVTYRGLFPVVVIVQNDAEIVSRRTVEGGSGRYERVQDEPNVDSATIAVEMALAYLDRDGRIPTLVDWTTQEHGFKAGQLVAIDLAREAVRGDFLITSVQAGYVGASLTEFSYHVTATDSGYLGGWVEFFLRLAQGQRAQIAREDESIIAVRAASVGVKASVSLAYTAAAPVVAIGTMVVGIGEVGNLP